MKLFYHGQKPKGISRSFSKKQSQGINRTSQLSQNSAEKKQT